MKRSLLLTLAGLWASTAIALPAQVEQVADYAAAQYSDAQIELLAELVRFQTVKQEGLANQDNPEFIGMKQRLHSVAEDFGFDYQDLGEVVVIGLGKGEHKLGIVTHGDVQPADASKWRNNPFQLDRDSEPGLLVARGTEDDKGPIATALFAMRSLKERNLPLNRRIELIVAMTEESDHEPFEQFVRDYPVPELNIVIDSQYPVVVAEKSWNSIKFQLPQTGAEPNKGVAWISQFSGGAFLTQVPEDAQARIESADAALEARLRSAAAAQSGLRYDFSRDGDALLIKARGKSAHSMNPELGVNAITHLAALLAQEPWPASSAAQAVALTHDLIGTGHYAEKFGDLAYAHDFMGPLTLSLGTVKQNDAGIDFAINFRGPAGKSTAQVEQEIHAALTDWQHQSNSLLSNIELKTEDAYYPQAAPHIGPLLQVFGHYSGISDPQPLSIGGGTNAKQLKNAVNFGPAMPGVAYSGHSEREFISVEQMHLNLRMYTAAIAWLAGESAHPAAK